MRFTRLFAAFLVSFAAAGPALAKDPVKLEVGYMPILPVAQAFVSLERGWIKEAGIEPKLVQFQNGPAMVQALLAGQLDIAYVGIGPAMVARAKGADVKVVASCIVEQISFIALGKLAPYFKSGEARTAFKRFAADHGRKPVISTFPVGSVPQTVLQYWLRNQLKIDPNEIEVVYQGDAVVQQSLLTDAVDGAAILEPTISIVKAKKADAAVVAAGSEMFPRQPGAVLLVREKLIAEHPELVQALVNAQKKSTELLRNDPKKAAVDVAKYVGGGRLELGLVETSIKGSKNGFVADPDFIVDGTRALHDFQIELGTLKDKVKLDELFEPKFYRSSATN